MTEEFEICCPAHFFRQYAHSSIGECKKVICCFHCEDRQTYRCLETGGCTAQLPDYPLNCSSYPISFKEMKKIWTFFKILTNILEKDYSNLYDSFLDVVDEFTEGKKRNDSNYKKERT